MKTSLLIFLLCLTTFVCHQDSGSTSENNKEEEANEVAARSILAGPPVPALKELKDFESKYESQWESRPVPFVG